MGRQSLKWPFLVIKQVSRTRTRLHIIEFFFLPKEFHGIPETTQAVNKTTDFFPQTDIKYPSLQTTHTQHIKHGKVELLPI